MKTKTNTKAEGSNQAKHSESMKVRSNVKAGFDPPQRPVHGFASNFDWLLG